MLHTNVLTRPEALALLASRGETRGDVYCLPNAVVVALGDRWLDIDELNAMEQAGLVSIRVEEVWCAPMGPRTPPIRHVSLTDSGRAAL